MLQVKNTRCRKLNSMPTLVKLKGRGNRHVFVWLNIERDFSCCLETAAEAQIWFKKKKVHRSPVLNLKNCQWLEPALLHQGIRRAIIVLSALPPTPPPYLFPISTSLPTGKPSPLHGEKEWEMGGKSAFRENKCSVKTHPFLLFRENH